MAIDIEKSRSRRAMLAGALGGLAALAAQAIGRPQSVSAGGGAVMLGVANLSDAPYTSIEGHSSASRAYLAGPGYGMLAEALASEGTGIFARCHGVDGTAARALTDGHNSQIAVDADASPGLGEGIAVRARTKNGIALYGEVLDTGGYALQAVGRAVFSRSGKVTFNGGQASKAVTGHPITAASLVLATIQGNVAGTWVRGVIVSDAQDKFTIKLNKPAPSSLTVGWFIVN